MKETPPLLTAEQDLRVRTYVRRWFNALFALDGPTWRALRRLVISPGRLAAEHLGPPSPGEAGAPRVHFLRSA